MEKHEKHEFQTQLMALCRGAYLEGWNNCNYNNQFSFEKTRTYNLIKAAKTPEEHIIKLLKGINQEVKYGNQ